MIITFALPKLVNSQAFSMKMVQPLYLEALADFVKVPLKLHKLDAEILIAKPDCRSTNLPSVLGNTRIQWFCFDKDIRQLLETKNTDHNGRSVILSSHKQLGADTVIVRIDQWVLGLEKEISFARINEDQYPEYRSKDHDYVFVKKKSKWELVKKAHTLNPLSKRAIEIEEIFQKGNSMHRVGKYKEALEYVERSMAMDSSFYQRYFFRAEIKEKLGMYESAISDITICIERCDCSTRKSHIASYLMKRAMLREKNRQFDLAIADANESILSNPKSWEGYYYRGVLFANNEQFEKALADLNKSFRLNSKIPEILIARGHIKAALGNFKDACSDFKVLKERGVPDVEKWILKYCS